MAEDPSDPTRGIAPTVDQVMSEVHLGCPPYFSGPYVTHFTFRIPPSPSPDTTKGCKDPVHGGEKTSTNQMLALDKDGDLVLARQSEGSMSHRLTIQHKITSSIPSVGLQVWRGALLLADFILHKIFTSSDLNGIVALELGAGTGLVGLLLSRVAKTVYLTDYGIEVLNNCAKNVGLNSGMFQHHGTSVHVRKLDWKESWPPAVGEHDFQSQQENTYSWTLSEVNEAEGASLILAADVIYSDDLTDAFFNTLERLMSRGAKKVLYMALEKRCNFSLDDLDVVANGYSHFQSYLKDEEELRKLGNGSTGFVAKLVDHRQIPQYIKEYDRGRDLEIWSIGYVSGR